MDKEVDYNKLHLLHNSPVDKLLRQCDDPAPSPLTEGLLRPVDISRPLQQPKPAIVASAARSSPEPSAP